MNLFLTIVLWMIGNKLTMGTWYYICLLIGLWWSFENYLHEN